MKKNWFVVLVVLASFLGAGIPLFAAEKAAAPMAPAPTQAAPAKKPAVPPQPPPQPAYLTKKVALLDGSGETTLEPLLKKGKYALVFFQTACTACYGELEFLKENFSQKDHLGIIGISVDVRVDWARDQVGKYQLPYDVFLSDPKFEFASLMGVSFTPVTVVLDKEGKEIGRVFGFDESKRGELAKLLRK